ncbi:MAG: hypothetical protein ABIZ07_11085, partial [Dermatophilaceae bacterium]
MLCAMVAVSAAALTQLGAPLALAAPPSAVTSVAPAAPAAPAAPGTISLAVSSARDVNVGPGFVHEGDPV